MKKRIASISVFVMMVTIASGQTRSQSAFKEINNISYLEKAKVGVDTLQRLNLILPEHAENAPTLIWIGGGAWSYVNRNMEMDLGRRVAKEGTCSFVKYSV